MKPVFMAEDGNSFDTSEECASYEKAMGIKNIVTAWAEEKYGDKQGQPTAAVNRVMAWEQVRDSLLAQATEEEPAVA